jgi:hypothetical protein
VVDPVAGPSSGDGPTIDEASGAAAVRLSIWQHPFVQNVVPLLSSVMLHGGIILFAFLTYKVVQIVNSPIKEQVVIPDAAISEGPEGSTTMRRATWHRTRCPTSIHRESPNRRTTI